MTTDTDIDRAVRLTVDDDARITLAIVDGQIAATIRIWRADEERWIDLGGEITGAADTPFIITTKTGWTR